MFRDSHGVVHTVSAADPLTDLPLSAATTLARALLTPVHGDLGSALERCEAVGALLDRWQDGFFAALPKDIDLEEEARYAAEAGVDLTEIDDQWDDDEDDEDDDPYGDEEVAGQLGLDVLDLEDLSLSHDDDPVTAVLDPDLVSHLERDLLLLPMRTRLEALLAASALVESWGDLLADHEKCLGHLVLAHHMTPRQLDHESLADQHAALHDGAPGHP